jgi:hypothetical protein
MWLYGCEVWDQTARKDAENLQIKIAKGILPCGLCTNNEAVLGELGLLKMQYVRERNKQIWWGRICCESISRLTKQVYIVEKRVFEYLKGKNPEKKTGMWIEDVYELLKKYGLEEEWNTHDVVSVKAWTRRVKMIVHKFAEDEWKLEMKKHPKLHQYCVLKQELKAETYLLDERLSVLAKRVICGLRTGTNKLQVELDRHEKVDVPREWRWCKLCATETEDEQHFMFQCPALQLERRRMLEEVKKVKKIDWTKSNVNKRARMAAFLGIGLQDKQMRVIVAKHVVNMWRKRSNILNRVKVV